MVTKNALELTAAAAADLLEALNIKDPKEDWTPEQTAEAIGTLPALTKDLDTAKLTVEQTDRLDEVLNALDGDIEITVLDPEEENDDIVPLKRPANGKKPAKKPAAKEAKPAAAKKETPAKPAKVEKPAAAKEERHATRPYIAGQVIAERGLAADLTDEMVAEVDGRAKKPNEAESRFCLRNARQAIQGYQAGRKAAAAQK
jgi:hypothetical protein